MLISNTYGFMDCEKLKIEYKDCCMNAVRFFFIEKNKYLLKCCDSNTSTFELCELKAKSQALKALDRLSSGSGFKTSLSGNRRLQYYFKVKPAYKKKRCVLDFLHLNNEN